MSVSPSARRALVAVNVLVAVALIATSAAYAYISWRLGRIDTVDFDGGLREAEAGGPLNILVVGSDSRAVIDPDERRQFGTEAQAGGKRTDTMLVVRIDPAQRRTAILSVPRDLWVPIAGTTRHDKINAAFARGPQALVATVSQALGLPIDHYVELDFKTFRAVVDALGGIDYHFPTPARDAKTGLDIRRPGCVHLDGDGALKLVRSRYYTTYSDGAWREDLRSDFGRIERQQQFMRLVLRKAAAAARNPFTLNSLLATVTDNLTVDDGFGPDKLRLLAERFRSLSPDAVELLSVPGTSGWVGDQSVVFIDEAGARPLLERFADGPVTVRAVTTTTAPSRRPTTTTPSPPSTTTTSTTAPLVAC